MAIIRDNQVIAHVMTKVTHNARIISSDIQTLSLIIRKQRRKLILLSFWTILHQIDTLGGMKRPHLNRIFSTSENASHKQSQWEYFWWPFMMPNDSIPLSGRIINFQKSIFFSYKLTTYPEAFWSSKNDYSILCFIIWSTYDEIGLRPFRSLALRINSLAISYNVIKKISDQRLPTNHFIQY